MKLVIAIINGDDVGAVVQSLTRGGFSATRLSTTGGFLKSKNTTIMIGTDDEEVERAIQIIRDCAGKRKTVRYDNPHMMPGGGGPSMNMGFPVDAEIGGCTIFVFPIERIEKY